MEDIWKTNAEAIEMIRKMLGCGEEEAKVILEEFKEDNPGSIKEVPVQ